MEMDQGVMRMRELKSGLEIKPGQTVELKPGSFHLMFVDLTRPLQKGDRIKGTLVFERAGKVDVDYAVEAIGAQPPMATASAAIEFGETARPEGRPSWSPCTRRDPEGRPYDLAGVHHPLLHAVRLCSCMNCGR